MMVDIDEAEVTKVQSQNDRYDYNNLTFLFTAKIHIFCS